MLTGIHFAERMDEPITSQSRAFGEMNKLTKNHRKLYTIIQKRKGDSAKSKIFDNCNQICRETVQIIMNLVCYPIVYRPVLLLTVLFFCRKKY